MALEPCLERLVRVQLGERSDCGDPERVPELCAKQAGDFIPLHVRKHYVDERNFGPVETRLFNPRRSIRGFIDLVPQRAQSFRGDVADIVAVVYDEHPQAALLVELRGGRNDAEPRSFVLAEDVDRLEEDAQRRGRFTFHPSHEVIGRHANMPGEFVDASEDLGSPY